MKQRFTFCPESLVPAFSRSQRALVPSEPRFLGRLAEGERGKLVNKVLEEFCAREPDDGLRLDLNVYGPAGECIEIRNKVAVGGAAN